ncbi:MAG: twin-arginine translocation (Tat) [Bradyrhizobium sp.]|uniref:twin-arginine translocation (Tat) n=1 Tax=Bradyrhizobium sp. TaxID=376 RepID=UPI003D1049DA
MERREFLKIAAGFAAGMAALAATAQAAPLAPQPLNEDSKVPANSAQPAVSSKEEADRLQPEEVRWGRGRHRGWGRRHWGWGRRHWGWRRRHWGWHRRRRHWRRRRYYGWA